MSRTQEANVPDKETLLQLKPVVKRTGFGKSTIYAWMNSDPPKFPKPVRVGGRAVRWRESDIDRWIEDQCSDLPDVESSSETQDIQRSKHTSDCKRQLSSKAGRADHQGKLNIVAPIKVGRS